MARPAPSESICWDGPFFADFVRQIIKGDDVQVKALSSSVLLSKGGGKESEPGQFRRSQNWIGGSCPGTATFIQPPPELVQECMGRLELFLHDEPEKTPVLIKAALAHVQFETIEIGSCEYAVHSKSP